MVKKRLSKTLSAAGVASRRKCEEIIFAGHIQVNGETVKTPQTLVDIATDKITLDGNPIKKEEPKVYYILNKPKGYVCSSTRNTGKRIVIDLFPDNTKRLFTVGRLDKDTTGLLLVTNDGTFANRIIHPSHNIPKEYLAKTMQEISHEHLKIISDGVYIDGKLVKPTKVKKVRRGTVKITVTDGKKHEVRLMLKKAGLKTLELSRIRIGNLTLGSLAKGEWRHLQEHEIQGFMDNN